MVQWLIDDALAFPLEPDDGIYPDAVEGTVAVQFSQCFLGEQVGGGGRHKAEMDDFLLARRNTS